MELSKKQEALEKQLETKRKEIYTESIAMSISELSSMYEEGSLYIKPAFQRYYRWKDEQKSRFIESILLKLPIPAIFVRQDSESNWEVIDGLQRLSTIFQFQGILKDEDKPAFGLEKGSILSEMDGLFFNDG
ncbi:DUF262 domain-containing protein, partial [bacterium]|nr:DUF262 domain-containing protein [bacterium]